MAEYTLSPTQSAQIESVSEWRDDDDPERCGADLARGGTCDRPAGECPYHGDGGDET